MMKEFPNKRRAIDNFIKKIHTEGTSAIITEWGKLSQRFIDRALVSGVAGSSAASSSKDTLSIIILYYDIWRL